MSKPADKRIADAISVIAARICVKAINAALSNPAIIASIKNAAYEKAASVCDSKASCAGAEERGEEVTIALAEQIAAVEREIRVRERVYPRRVLAGNMSPKKAVHEQAAMQAALATLRAVAELVPLLVTGWDEYDDDEDQRAGRAAVDKLIEAANIERPTSDEQPSSIHSVEV